MPKAAAKEKPEKKEKPAKAEKKEKPAKKAAAEKPAKKEKKAKVGCLDQLEVACDLLFLAATCHYMYCSSNENFYCMSLLQH